MSNVIVFSVAASDTGCTARRIRRPVHERCKATFTVEIAGLVNTSGVVKVHRTVQAYIADELELTATWTPLDNGTGIYQFRKRRLVIVAVGEIGALLMKVTIIMGLSGVELRGYLRRRGHRLDSIYIYIYKIKKRTGEYDYGAIAIGLFFICHS